MANLCVFADALVLRCAFKRTKAKEKHEKAAV